jgi:DNA polymerase-3 subunit beta
MIIKASIEALKSMLQPLSAHVGRDGLVLFEISPNGLTVTANNGATQKSTKNSSVSGEDESFIIEYRKLNSLVSSLEGDKIATIKVDGGKFSFSCSKTKMTTSTIPPQSFPKIEQRESVAIDCDFMEIKRGIDLVSSSTNKDDTNKLFCAVAIVSDGSTIDVVATDKARISIYTINSSTSEFEVVIPIRSCSALKADLDSAELFSIGDGKVKLSSDSFETIINLIDHRYVPYKRVVPSTGVINELTFDRETMLSCLSRINIVASDPKSTRCILSMDENGAEASLNGIFVVGGSSEITELLPVNNTGGKLNIAYNPNWLQDAISKYAEDTIVCRIHDGKMGQLVLSNEKLTSILTQMIV